MKPCVLRPLARDDRRSEVGYYRKEAGEQVALRLVDAMAEALEQISHHPGMGSPMMHMAR